MTDSIPRPKTKPDSTPEMTKSGNTLNYTFRSSDDLATQLNQESTVLDIRTVISNGVCYYNLVGQFNDNPVGNVWVVAKGDDIKVLEKSDGVNWEWSVDGSDSKYTAKIPLLASSTPGFHDLEKNHETKASWDVILRHVSAALHRVKKEQEKDPNFAQLVDKELQVLEPTRIKVRPYKDTVPRSAFVNGAAKASTAATPAKSFNLESYLAEPGRPTIRLSSGYMFIPSNSVAQQSLLGGLSCDFGRMKYFTPAERHEMEKKKAAGKKRPASSNKIAAGSSKEEETEAETNCD
jgi:hypothetical protein